MLLEINFAPVRLKPDFIKVRPVNTQRSPRVLERDEMRVWERLPDRPRNADTWLGVVPSVRPTNDYAHARSPHATLRQRWPREGILPLFARHSQIGPSHVLALAELRPNAAELFVLGVAVVATVF